MNYNSKLDALEKALERVKNSLERSKRESSGFVSSEDYRAELEDRIAFLEAEIEKEELDGNRNV
jgi:hypothetical protein